MKLAAPAHMLPTFVGWSLAPHQARSSGDLQLDSTLACRADKGWARNGQTMVEFAFIAPLFLLLICGVMDYGRLFFTQSSIEDAVQQAGRYGSTGNAKTGLTRLQSIEAVLQQAAVGINVPIQNIQISSFTNGVWVPGSAGGPGETVAITVTMGMKLLTPMIGQYFFNGVYTFTASTTFQNEPFSAG
jgi:Flp pilus assembly protein TadG